MYNDTLEETDYDEYTNTTGEDDDRSSNGLKWVIAIIIILACLYWLRIVTTLTRPVSEYVLNFLYFLVVGNTKLLPPITNRILLMTVIELAEKIRKRQLKVEEVMTAFVERCKEIQPLINVATDERFEEALEEAVAMDHMLATVAKTEDQLAKETPLLGVPFSSKESIGIKGLSQTNGIWDARDRKAEEDSDAATMYRRAGAIPFVVTNGPERGRWWESANLVHGWTKNPYDKRRTVGGSSGGEAAILTSSGAPMGIGNGFGNDIRIPTSFCGIYAHKPSRDLISNHGYWPDDGKEYTFFFSTGPMCRYAEELPLLTRILSGKDASKVPFDSEVDFRKVKIYYVEEYQGILLSATNDIKDAVRKAAKHFEEEFNVSATKLDIPELTHSFAIWECKLLEYGGASFRSRIDPDGEMSLLWEFFLSILRQSKHTWPALYYVYKERRTKDDYYYQCLNEFDSLKRKIEEYFEDDAILLIPTHPDPPPHYLMTIPKNPNLGNTCIWTVLGYPATQIPAGLSYGVPIGIQVISSQFKDHLTLAAAIELDKVMRGWINPSPIDL